MENVVEAETHYFGKDCPVGMVQVEFVGCSPSARHSDYGYKPVESAFLEIYVDGQRFRIDVGSFQAGDGSWRRGLHINMPFKAEIDKHSVNAMDIFLPDAPSTKEQLR